MTFVSLSRASELYDFASRLQVGWHRVEHALFREFSKATQSLLRRLGNMSRDEFWQGSLGPLRRYRFYLNVLPVPFSDPSVLQSAGTTGLASQVDVVTSLYPSYAGQYSEAVAMLAELMGTDDAPLLEAIRQATDTENSCLLLTSRTIHRVLSSSPTVRLPHGMMYLPHSDLRDESFEQIVVCGPLAWFPDWILASPRAPRIDVVRYGWLRDRAALEPVFVGGLGVPVKSEAEAPNADPEDLLEPSELVLRIDWDDMYRRFSSSADDTDEQEEAFLVLARLVLLEGGWASYAQEGSSRLIISLEDGARPRLKRVQTAEIQPGSFLLLRTAGGGDLIRPVADSIMGSKARRLRESLLQWKRKLRRFVSANGMPLAVLALKRFGSTRASEPNIRNWMSSSHIRPNDFRDFLATMTLVGMKDDAKKLWENAQTIYAAHKKAGFRIRKILLKRVSSVDPATLRRESPVEFSLGAESAPTITAFRVEDVSPKVYEVAEHRLDVPFRTSQEQVVEAASRVLSMGEGSSGPDGSSGRARV